MTTSPQTPCRPRPRPCAGHRRRRQGAPHGAGQGRRAARAAARAYDAARADRAAARTGPDRGDDHRAGGERCRLVVTSRGSGRGEDLRENSHAELPPPVFERPAGKRRRRRQAGRGPEPWRSSTCHPCSRFAVLPILPVAHDDEFMPSLPCPPFWQGDSGRRRSPTHSRRYPRSDHVPVDSERRAWRRKTRTCAPAVHSCPIRSLAH